MWCAVMSIHLVTKRPKHLNVSSSILGCLVSTFFLSFVWCVPGIAVHTPSSHTGLCIVFLANFVLFSFMIQDVELHSKYSAI